MCSMCVINSNIYNLLPDKIRKTLWWNEKRSKPKMNI